MPHSSGEWHAVIPKEGCQGYACSTSWVRYSMSTVILQVGAEMLLVPPHGNISSSGKQCFHTGLRHLSVIHSTHSRNANGPDHLTVLHKQKPTFHGHGAR